MLKMFDMKPVKVRATPLKPVISLGRVAGKLELSPEEESLLIDRYNRTQPDEHSVGTIIGDGDAKPPTSDCLRKFAEMRDQFLPPIVKSDTKELGGIFHGKHNINRIYKRDLGENSQQILRDTYDYDIWVESPIRRADRMQKKLDNHMGCDIAYAKKEISPRDAKSRWVVKSRGTEDKHEVDYVSYPDPIIHPYRTEMVDGIECETLDSAMAREEDIKKQVPMRYFKSAHNLQDYRQYKKMKGGEPF